MSKEDLIKEIINDLIQINASASIDIGEGYVDDYINKYHEMLGDV